MSRFRNSCHINISKHTESTVGLIASHIYKDTVTYNIIDEGPWLHRFILLLCFDLVATDDL